MIYSYNCIDCGEKYNISKNKNRTFDGKRCNKCNSGRVVPTNEVPKNMRFALGGQRNG